MKKFLNCLSAVLFIITLCGCTEKKTSKTESSLENDFSFSSLNTQEGLPVNINIPFISEENSLYSATDLTSESPNLSSETPPKSISPTTSQVTSPKTTEPSATVSTQTTSAANSTVTSTSTKTTTTTQPSTTTIATTPTTTAPVVLNGKAINYQTQKAVWITQFELSPILLGKTESEFRNSFSKIIDNCVSNGLNTVYVQVRPYGDAIYNSSVYPPSKYLSYGKANFDPLKIMIDLAHAKNISFHAWVNPFRLMTADEFSSASAFCESSGNVFKTVEWWKSRAYDDKKNAPMMYDETTSRWWLNPANPNSRQLIVDGVAEIPRNYAVDGVNIDDYFYPTANMSWDSEYYNAHKNSETQSQFRFNATSATVKAMRNSIKSINSDVLFGISPAGNIDSNYTTLFADVKTWASSREYCDYMTPQIYFGFNNETRPFEDTLIKWKEITNVSLYAGLAAYKVGVKDVYAGSSASAQNEWINGSYAIISKQVSLSLDKVSGYAIFSYSYLQ